MPTPVTFYSTSGYDYTSQGLGADLYAEVAAKLQLARLLLAGIKADLDRRPHMFEHEHPCGACRATNGFSRDEHGVIDMNVACTACLGTRRVKMQAKRVSHDDFVIVVYSDDILAAQRAPQLPAREWVRMCWKNGANPRVYNPFIPADFEEKHDLDLFGNDLRK